MVLRFLSFALYKNTYLIKIYLLSNSELNKCDFINIADRLRKVRVARLGNKKKKNYLKCYQLYWKITNRKKQFEMLIFVLKHNKYKKKRN